METRTQNPYVMSSGNGIFSGLDVWKILFLALAGYGSYHLFKAVSGFISAMKSKPTASLPTHSE